MYLLKQYDQKKMQCNVVICQVKLNSARFKISVSFVNIHRFINIYIYIYILIY